MEKPAASGLREARSLAVVWAQFGPYHLARLDALRKAAPSVELHALEFSNVTLEYHWRRSRASTVPITLAPASAAEEAPFSTVFLRARRKLAELRIEVCLLPSYWPKQSLAALLAAKSLGIRTVMMNESHAGTARATGMGAWLKRALISLFDAALVGGTPQKRYFASMGMRPEQIFTGYDAIDNEYFLEQAEQRRLQEARLRSNYRLPAHYFLSLGRLVAKKNLGRLIDAYRLYLNATPPGQRHLVMVGSGEEEAKLRSRCVGLGLPVYEKEPAGRVNLEVANGPSAMAEARPGVHFYGFRQIDENPVFYALADAFVLPSVREEWGLVVNEAMASGLPVIVSERAGCAEDLMDSSDLETAFSKPITAALLQSGLAGRIRRNGFVFDPENTKELAAIFRHLESFPAMRLAMGQRSWRRVAKCSCENFARNALLAVQAALNRGRPRICASSPLHPVP